MSALPQNKQVAKADCECPLYKESSVLAEKNQLYERKLYQLGVNSPADIASGRIAEVCSRSISCNCMTHTSQQECRGILEF